MLIPIPFAIQTYQDVTRQISSQDLLNMYTSQKFDGSKSRVVLQNTPGLKQWTTVGDGPIRLVFRRDNRQLFVVSKNEVYFVDANKSKTLLGTVPSTGICIAASNANDTIIIVGSSVYNYNSTSGFQPISLGFVPSDIIFQDSYLIASEAASQKFYINDLFSSPPVFGAFDFTQANIVADNIVGLASANRSLWVFGEYSTQIYYNSGSLAFPFALTPNGVLNVGLLSKSAKCVNDGIVFWVGNDFRCYMSSGLQPQLVSTDVIEAAIEDAANPLSASCLAYKQFGRTFFVLSTSEKTFVYDATTGLWHRRESTGYVDGDGPWRAAHFSEFNTLRIAGSRDENKLYEIDLETHTEGSNHIRRVFTSQTISFEMRQTTMRKLIIDMDMGAGLATGQGSDPMLMMQFSDDGGNTWSNELWRGMGKMGEYTNRIVFERLGQFRQRILRFSVSDPINVVAISAHAEVDVGEL